MSAKEVRRFGIEPQVALVSHSNGGSINDPSAVKMRQVLELVREKAPDLIIDGEMHCDIALSENLRKEVMPDSPIKGAANLLIMPNMETARISLGIYYKVQQHQLPADSILMGGKTGTYSYFCFISTPYY